MAKWRTIKRELLTKKVIQSDQEATDRLKRCLTALDLTALGVGSTLGVGVYVLVGFVALNIAGPSIVISFLIAAVVSMVAGVCYAELGARMPQAGSAYIYTYISIGEIFAFIVGWNMLLDYLFGTASVARGLSLYIDMLTGKAISAWFTSFAPMYGTYLCDYFDFFAFFVVLIMGGILAVGMKLSSIVSNVCAFVNMTVILFVIVAGAFTANPNNWWIPAAQVPAGMGSGGFFPYGVWGTLRGAAICFYGFVGFETICHISEEVKCPRRSVPLSIMLVLVVVLTAYGGISIVLTMMVPYYLQDKDASVGEAFKYVGWAWAQWVVAVGAVFGMVASIFGAMLPVSRLLYAMASDGLIFRFLSQVNQQSNTPLVATVLSTVTMAVLAGLLDLQQILMMMSFGTLLSYSIVAAEVIVLRYHSKAIPETQLGIVKQVFAFGVKTPTKPSYTVVNIALSLFCVTCLVNAVVWTHTNAHYAIVCVLTGIALLLIAVMSLHPQNKEDLDFKTPLVPLIPCLSIYSNIHLMILISYQTWIRNAIWLVFGIIIYAICSIKYKRCSRREQDKAHKDKNGNMPTAVASIQISDQETIKQSQPPEVKKNTEDVIEKYSEFEHQVKQLNDYKIPEESKMEVVMLQAFIETNEEKEAKIIDLLDQVLQAEEDSYADTLADQTVDVSNSTVANDDHRSIGDISTAESDASLGNQILSKYDVVAQVHREDMPRLSEVEEKQDNDETEVQEVIIQFDHGQEYDQNESEFNGSETNSRTDESGYSDTMYKSTINNSTEDTTQDNAPFIPTPPPMDESYFAKPTLRKSYSMNFKKLPKSQLIEIQADDMPRKSIQSVQSNGSMDDGHIVFGSDKQMNFMTKLNNLFQTKILTDGEVHRARSNSTGNAVEDKLSVLERPAIFGSLKNEIVSKDHTQNLTPANSVPIEDKLAPSERPAIFADLNKEILSKDHSQNLRPANIEVVNSTLVDKDDDDADTSLTRSDLKSKLEIIFANGGPQLMNSRIKKSTSPHATPETETSSPESIPKLPKMDLNDTLKRQKDKFGAVLNSLRLSVNQNDLV